MIKLFFLFSLITTSIYCQEKRNFNCNLFKEVYKRVLLQKDRVRIFSAIKDSFEVLVTKENKEIILNKSSIPDCKFDSLLEYCNFKDYLSVFYDSMFQFKKNTIVLDTFGFFDSDCDFSMSNITFSFKNFNYKDYKKKFDEQEGIIVLKLIKTYRNRLVLAFQDDRSDMEIEFHFDFVANRKIELVEVFAEYPLYPLIKRK